MSEIPRELNWVKERSECSVVHVFKQLKMNVEEDCKAFNDIRQLSPANAFMVLGSDSGNVFGVVSGEYQTREVKFHLGKDFIYVSNEKTHKEYRLTLTLNDEGRCKLRIAEEELEEWQVRRRILEEIFF